MVEITVRGDLQTVLQNMQNINGVVKMRKADGWSLFQDDEDWNYEARRDERTCNVCLSFVGRWTGSQIPAEFQHLKVWEKAWIKPGVHITYPELGWSRDPDAYGGCRCNIYWPDYMYVLTERLGGEMERAAI